MESKLRNHVACASFVFAAAGCATPSTGVVELSDGLAKVTRHGAGPWVPTSELKAQGIQEAGVWCERFRLRARVIDVKEIQARPLGGQPEAEILFTCA